MKSTVLPLVQNEIPSSTTLDQYGPAIEDILNIIALVGTIELKIEEDDWFGAGLMTGQSATSTYWTIYNIYNDYIAD